MLYPTCVRTTTATTDQLVHQPIILSGHVHLLSLKNTGPVDDITENWLIKADLCHMLDCIKSSHQAVPLHIFVEMRLIAPVDICNVLTGALIELHFKLYHFSIRGKNIDSFNVKIEQVMVLQPGKTCPDTIYKRSTAEEGPIHMNPMLLLFWMNHATFIC